MVAYTPSCRKGSPGFTASSGVRCPRADHSPLSVGRAFASQITTTDPSCEIAGRRCTRPHAPSRSSAVVLAGTDRP